MVCWVVGGQLHQNVNVVNPWVECTHWCLNMIWHGSRSSIMPKPTIVDWINIIGWAPKCNKHSKGKMFIYVNSSWIVKHFPCCTPRPFLMSLMHNQWELMLEGWIIGSYNLSWRRNVHLIMYQFLKSFLQVKFWQQLWCYIHNQT
jgi:hypothetical protein